jgi:hypothetical protein
LRNRKRRANVDRIPIVWYRGTFLETAVKEEELC